MQHLDAEIPSQVLEMYLGLEPWSAGYFRVVQGARIQMGLRLCRILRFGKTRQKEKDVIPHPQISLSQTSPNPCKHYVYGLILI